MPNLTKLEVQILQSGELRLEGVDLSHVGLSAILPTQAKCCSRCAFRVGSEERADPWGWIRLAESFESGAAFLCHEGIPGHRCQKDGEPLRLCAGRAALEGKPMAHLGYPSFSSLSGSEQADAQELYDAVIEQSHSEQKRLK